MVVDELARRIGATFRAHKAQAATAEGRLAGARVVLAKSRSYMNTSGGPVRGLRDYFSLPTDRLVVVHDELDLPYGALRVKRGGGDNGHNGLRSITSSLGDREYYRVRFGIGRPHGRMDVVSFVLKDFSAAERKELDLNVSRAADAVEVLLADGLERAQNVFNTAPGAAAQ
jgi:PTH1 family peptidyl-tRNA hydrolase